MKKMISMLTSIVLVASLVLSGSALAKSGTDATIALTTSSSTTTLSTAVDVVLNADNTEDLYGIELQIRYDSQFLEYKGNTVSAEYTKLDGDKMTAGTIFMPLVRKNTGDTGAKAQLTLATFHFVGIKAGTTEIEITQVKAVTSGKYTNSQGKDDLVAHALVVQQPLQITIKEASGPSPTPTPSSSPSPTPTPSSSPSPTPSLSPTPSSSPSQGTQDSTNSLIEQLKNEKDPSKGAQLVNTLLNQVSGSTSSATKTSIQNAVQGYVEQLLKVNGGTSVKDVLAVLDTVDQLKNKAEAKGILLKVNGVYLNTGSGSILMAREMLNKLSPEGKLDLVTKAAAGGVQEGASLNPISGIELQYTGQNGGIQTVDELFQITIPFTAGSADEQLLGLYYFDSVNNRWEYVQDAVRDGSSFSAQVDRFGTYAVIEYTKNFADLNNSYAEAKRAIQVLAAQHIISGVDNEHYAPLNSVTRAEIAKLFVSLLKLPLSSESNSMSDVNSNDWYAEYVAAAQEAGFIKGYEDGTFKPNQPVSREQVAAIMVALYEKEYGAIDISNVQQFGDDSQISSWAKEAVYKARAAGLLAGTGDNQFNPQSSMSRQDAAVILLRLSKLF